MKDFGYATGQFGKNHLGDRNEHLPTVHGFDEFFGNLYHLNAEEEPEYENYPKDPAFRKKFGPRGVLKCKASDKDDATVDEQFGKVGKQVIENTGPLTRKRMETVDEEFLGAALDFIDRKTKEGTPVVLLLQPDAHARLHAPEAESSQGKTGLGLYPDGMVELDGYVGQLLKKLDDLGVADNTIVVFTTDNGAEVLSWPDGGATPFRGEKDTNWEGGWRVPCVMRWPGVIEPGRVINDICSLQDFIPTFAAANGEPDLVEKVKKGYKIGDKTFKVHLDGYNLLPFLSGKEEKSPARRLHLLERRRRLHGRCAWAASRSSSPSSAARASTSGASRCRRCAFPSSSTCAPTRSSAARRASSTTTGSWSRTILLYVGAAAAGEVAGELQGVPAARQGRELQHRPGRREADAEGLKWLGGRRQ